MPLTQEQITPIVERKFKEYLDRLAASQKKNPNLIKVTEGSVSYNDWLTRIKNKIELEIRQTESTLLGVTLNSWDTDDVENRLSEGLIAGQKPEYNVAVYDAITLSDTEKKQLQQKFTTYLTSHLTSQNLGGFSENKEWFENIQKYFERRKRGDLLAVGIPDGEWLSLDSTWEQLTQEKLAQEQLSRQQSDQEKLAKPVDNLPFMRPVQFWQQELSTQVAGITARRDLVHEKITMLQQEIRDILQAQEVSPTDPGALPAPLLPQVVKFKEVKAKKDKDNQIALLNEKIQDYKKILVILTDQELYLTLLREYLTIKASDSQNVVQNGKALLERVGKEFKVPTTNEGKNQGFNIRLRNLFRNLIKLPELQEDIAFIQSLTELEAPHIKPDSIFLEKFNAIWTKYKNSAEGKPLFNMIYTRDAQCKTYRIELNAFCKELQIRASSIKNAELSELSACAGAFEYFKTVNGRIDDEIVKIDSLQKGDRGRERLAAQERVAGQEKTADSLQNSAGKFLNELNKVHEKLQEVMKFNELNVKSREILGGEKKDEILACDIILKWRDDLEVGIDSPRLEMLYILHELVVKLDVVSKVATHIFEEKEEPSNRVLEGDERTTVELFKKYLTSIFSWFEAYPEYTGKIDADLKHKVEKLIRDINDFSDGKKTRRQSVATKVVKKLLRQSTIPEPLTNETLSTKSTGRVKEMIEYYKDQIARDLTSEDTASFIAIRIEMNQMVSAVLAELQQSSNWAVKYKDLPYFAVLKLLQYAKNICKLAAESDSSELLTQAKRLKTFAESVVKEMQKSLGKSETERLGAAYATKDFSQSDNPTTSGKAKQHAESTLLGLVVLSGATWEEGDEYIIVNNNPLAPVPEPESLLIIAAVNSEAPDEELLEVSLLPQEELPNVGISQVNDNDELGQLQVDIWALVAAHLNRQLQDAGNSWSRNAVWGCVGDYVEQYWNDHYQVLASGCETANALLTAHHTPGMEHYQLVLQAIELATNLEAGTIAGILAPQDVVTEAQNAIFYTAEQADPAPAVPNGIPAPPPIENPLGYQPGCIS